MNYEKSDDTKYLNIRREVEELDGRLFQRGIYSSVHEGVLHIGIVHTKDFVTKRVMST